MNDVVFFTFLKIITGVVVGGVLGSFIGVLLYRLPRKESIITPPSHCNHCKRTLEPRDLIPVISYFLNMGKCRFCNQEISISHLIIEVAAIIIVTALFLIFIPAHPHITYNAPINDFIHQL